MHRGVDVEKAFGRQLGKTSAPIQGLCIRRGFSRYEAQQMTDHQIRALVAQVQANTAKIDAESSARAIADEALASRVTAAEVAIAAMSLQSIWRGRKRSSRKNCWSAA